MSGMSSWVTLGVALGMLVLWIVALAQESAQAWLSWLIFVFALVLLASAVIGFAIGRRRLG